jgi:hypothetical protein
MHQVYFLEGRFFFLISNQKCFLNLFSYTKIKFFLSLNFIQSFLKFEPTLIYIYKVNIFIIWDIFNDFTCDIRSCEDIALKERQNSSWRH